MHREHARLIHRGKLLKKGDVWPGSLVQLFGTIKGGTGSAGATDAHISQQGAPLKLITHLDIT
jgi:hypothetical protein